MQDDPRDVGPDAAVPPSAPSPTPSVLEPVSPTPTQGPAGRSGKSTVVGAIVVGGIAGAVILGPLNALAASPTPSAVTASPSGGADASAAPSAGASAAPSADTKSDTDSDSRSGAHGGPGGHVEAVTDTSVAAKAIGISEADLLAALATGKTVADVATAHDVAVQTVIDALVADGESELAAQVANGTLTQAQADTMKAEVTQRATDQVNSTFSGDHH